MLLPDVTAKLGGTRAGVFDQLESPVWIAQYLPSEDFKVGGAQCASLEGYEVRNANEDVLLDQVSALIDRVWQCKAVSREMLWSVKKPCALRSTSRWVVAQFQNNKNRSVHHELALLEGHRYSK